MKPRSKPLALGGIPNGPKILIPKRHKPKVPMYSAYTVNTVSLRLL